MSLFGKKDKELSELRSVLSVTPTTKIDSTDEVRERLRKLKTDTYKDYPPQEYGLRIWWVLGFEGEKEYVEGPYFTEGEAEAKFANYSDGGVFLLRDITAKSEAKKAIKAILRAQKLQQEIQQREEKLV